MEDDARAKPRPRLAAGASLWISGLIVSLGVYAVYLFASAGR